MHLVMKSAWLKPAKDPVAPAKRRLNWFVAGTLVLYAASGSSQGAPTKFVTVVRTGDAAPGLPGLTFRSFNSPVLNNAGHVAFFGSLTWTMGVTTLNDDGLWAGLPGSLQLIAREADPVPGLSHVFYQSFSNIGLDEGGNVVFCATVQGPSVGITNNTAFFGWAAGTINLIAREGDPAPGTTNGIFFGDLGQLNALALVVGRPGEIAFRASVTGQVTVTNDTGIWCGPYHGIQLLAREGNPAPAPLPAAAFDSLLFENPALNPVGVVCFDGDVKTTTPFPPDASGVWIGNTNGLVLALQSAVTPSPVPGATFKDFEAVTFNTQTQFCFVATLNTGSVTNNTAILAGPVANLIVVARQGDPAPGMPPGVGFDTLAQVEPLLGTAGHVAFAATVLGPGIGSSNNMAIWAGQPEALHMVCRRGAQAQGLPEGVLFKPGYAATFDLAGLNRQGHIAFIAQLEGPGVTSDNEAALWAGQPGCESLILRRGDWIDLGDRVPRQIFTIKMVDISGEMQVSGGQDGRSRSLNDRGECLLHVTFVSGQGDAILLVPSVADPDQNGVPTLLELAHGLGAGETCNDLHSRAEVRDGQCLIYYRVNPQATHVGLVVKGATSLDGPWTEMTASSSLADDQSGLPAGIERRQMAVPLSAESARFFRVEAFPR